MPGIDPSGISAIAQGVEGVANIVDGFIKNGKAKRIERNNPRPMYDIQQPIKDNQALAESEAGQGMSDSARTAYDQEAERGVSASMDAILKSGGSANNIGDLYGNYSTGLNHLAVLDEQIRTQKVARLMDQNQQMADEMDKQWEINKYAPYADKAAAAANYRQQSSQAFSTGLNTLIGAGANYASSQEYGNNTGQGQSGGTGPYTGRYGAPTDWAPSYVPRGPIPASAANGLATRYPGLGYGYSGFTGPKNYGG